MVGQHLHCNAYIIGLSLGQGICLIMSHIVHGRLYSYITQVPLKLYPTSKPTVTAVSPK